VALDGGYLGFLRLLGNLHLGWRSGVLQD
jgi:hypothetical protein